MRYEFKKIVKNDYETYKYLLKIYNSISYCKDKEMIFDLFGTQRFESNLIAILYLIKLASPPHHRAQCLRIGE